MRNTTMRKTLIAALTALLVLAGFSSQAMAQDTTTTATTDTTTTDTTTADTTTTDTTTTDTTTTDTTADTTTTTDTTTADTTAADGQGESNLGESFATDTPNPAPGQPVATAEETAAAPPDASAQVAGETQLAYTGTDTRIVALALLLLGAGLAFIVASRRQEPRLAVIEAWLE